MARVPVKFLKEREAADFLACSHTLIKKLRSKGIIQARQLSGTTKIIYEVSQLEDFVKNSPQIGKGVD